jgi:hypothetical protein
MMLSPTESQSIYDSDFEDGEVTPKLSMARGRLALKNLTCRNSPTAPLDFSRENEVSNDLTPVRAFRNWREVREKNEEQDLMENLNTRFRW